jgi:lactoylglutathione lyase
VPLAALYHAGSSMEQLVKGVAHVGIRVAKLERSLEFYRHLGFELVAGPIGPEPVVILKNASGTELNLILNAQAERAHNVLMDEPVKHAGYTHIALECDDIAAAQVALERAGISLSGGPVTFPHGHQAIFVRDPDRNVIELHQGL